MPGTPNPTINDLLEIDDLVNGDIGQSQQEVVERLAALLPDFIAAKNTAKSWTGVNAMRAPLAGDIQIAPTVITQRHKNMVLVAMSETTEAEGIGGAFRNFWDLTVHLMEDRLETIQQVRTAWRRGECVKTCLFPFLSGCAGTDGKLRWKVCQPTGMSIMDDEVEGKLISVVTVSFRMIQPPSYGTGY